MQLGPYALIQLVKVATFFFVGGHEEIEAGYAMEVDSGGLVLEETTEDMSKFSFSGIPGSNTSN